MGHARPKTLLALIGCFGAIAAVASSPASAAPTSCANVNITPNVSNIETVRAAVQCLVNNEREAHGESALRANAKLQRAAQGHSEEMASEDYFSHYAPDGSTPLERMRASGYIYSSQIGYEVGENIAWGTLWLTTPEAIVNAWMASPEHRANILDGRYRDSGIGVVAQAPASLADGQSGALYTQDFGTIVSPTGHASRHDGGPSASRHRDGGQPSNRRRGGGLAGSGRRGSGDGGRDSGAGRAGGHMRKRHRRHHGRKHHRKHHRKHRRRHDRRRRAKHHRTHR